LNLTLVISTSMRKFEEKSLS